MSGVSDDESFFDPDFFANDWDDLHEISRSPQRHPFFDGNHADLFNMRFNPRTGTVDVDGPAGLFLAAVALVGNMMSSGDSDSARERDLRREAQQRESEAKQKAEKLEREIQEATERANQAEREKEAETEKLKLEEELRALGIEPDRNITDDDISSARRAIGYKKNHVNIGIVGRQNEGKSTLVNCFRGLRHREPDSAKIGETEVTEKCTPYQDHKHQGVVWHDIPGGGTGRTSAWGYYYDQRLFAYDKLVLVHTSVLSELDLKILQICQYYNRVCVVVRSKADEHIRNCKRNAGHTTVEAARDDYIRQVRDEMAAKNEEARKSQALCPNYIDHIVCEMGVTQLVNGETPSEDPYEQVIDEDRLLKKLELME